jgi:iron complex outermembrane recepter protein
MTWRYSICVTCSVIALITSSQAWAQSTVTKPQSPETDSPLEEVVVTALKRSESLQDVPAAITVVTGDRLTQSGVTNISQLGNVSTGVAVEPVRTTANIFIRGVGTLQPEPAVDTSVALNLNGVFLPTEVTGAAFFDVDRIEFLPGPQGTLYGANSTGGVVNISSRMPGDKFSVDAFVEGGNYGRLQTVAGLDLPLSSTLSSRTAVMYIQHDGYNSSGSDDQQDSAARETLVWGPGADTKVILVGTYTHSGGVGNVLQNIPDVGGCGYRCDNFDAHNLGFYNRQDVYQVSLNLEQRLSDNLSLTYIGGYNNLGSRVYNALLGGPPTIPAQVNQTLAQYSHELRLNADIGKLKTIIGGYYFDKKGYYYNALYATPFLPANPAGGYDVKEHDASVFGNANYSLTDALRLTGGVRYSHVVRSIDGYNDFLTAGLLPFAIEPFAGEVPLNRGDWKAGLDFDVTPDTMIYTNAGSGYTPGGFSSGQAVSGQLPAAPFRPTTLIAYTAGVKNRLANGKLTLNLEGFYYDYRNYQLTERDPVTLQNLVYNAAKSTVDGVQVDSSLRPDRNDELAIGATFLHAKNDILRTPAGNFDGVSLFNAPEVTANASYQHSFDVRNDAQIRANVNFKYTSGRWLFYKAEDGPPQFYAAGNTHTDLELGYFAAQDRWSFNLFVRNLEDHLVKSICANSIPGPAGCYFEPPRTYGGRVAVQF